MRILFLPRYHDEGPSSRYRTFNYLPYFVAAGHTVEVQPLFHKGYVANLYAKTPNSMMSVVRSAWHRLKYIMRHKRDFDLMVVEKELFPYAPGFVERCLLAGVRYALDYDDAIGVQYLSTPLLRLMLGGKVDSLSDGAVLATVGNRWYWTHITRGRLQYLPTVIDITKYEVICEPRMERVPVVVWIGSPSTVRYLQTIRAPLQRLAGECSFVLRVIGANVEMPGVRVECVPWNEDTEVSLLATSDIGVMPLEDTMWEHGKCGFKCIQYMGARLPVVASPLPANREIIVHGETGYLVRSEDDWYTVLKTLINDSDLRTRLGEFGRTRVEEHYTYQVWGDRYVSLLRDAANGNPDAQSH